MPRFWVRAWQIIVIASAIAAFFGFNVDWRLISDVLTSADIWLLNNAAYPTLFALFLGLATGTIVIPEVLRHTWPSHGPNMTLDEFTSYLFIESKEAAGQPASRELLEALELQIRDAARCEEIQIWGRLFKNYTHKSIPPQAPISPIYWDTATFVISGGTTQINGGPVIRSTSIVGTIDYRDLWFNKTQSMRRWKRANWLERHRDKYRHQRSAFLEGEVVSPSVEATSAPSS